MSAKPLPASIEILARFMCDEEGMARIERALKDGSTKAEEKKLGADRRTESRQTGRLLDRAVAELTATPEADYYRSLFRRADDFDGVDAADIGDPLILLLAHFCDIHLALLDPWLRGIVRRFGIIRSGSGYPWIKPTVGPGSTIGQLVDEREWDPIPLETYILTDHDQLEHPVIWAAADAGPGLVSMQRYRSIRRLSIKALLKQCESIPKTQRESKEGRYSEKKGWRFKTRIPGVTSAGAKGKEKAIDVKENLQVEKYGPQPRKSAELLDGLGRDDSSGSNRLGIADQPRLDHSEERSGSLLLTDGSDLTTPADIDLKAIVQARRKSVKQSGPAPRKPRKK